MIIFVVGPVSDKLIKMCVVSESTLSLTSIASLGQSEASSHLCLITLVALSLMFNAVLGIYFVFVK